MIKTGVLKTRGKKQARKMAKKSKIKSSKSGKTCTKTRGVLKNIRKKYRLFGAVKRQKGMACKNIMV